MKKLIQTQDEMTIALSYILVFISINKFCDDDYVDWKDRINFGQSFQVDIRVEFEWYVCKL